MRSLRIIKELITSLVVVIAMPIFLAIAVTIITVLMYIALLDDLYIDFKIKTRKKVNDEH